MIKSDLGSYIKTEAALHAINYDGASALNGPDIDRLPQPQQTFDSCVFVLRLEDAAADEDVDVLVEESVDGGVTYTTLKDVGVVTYDESAGGTLKVIEVDLSTAAKHIRLTVQDEASSDTDVGGTDLTVTAACVLGGAYKTPTE